MPVRGYVLMVLLTCVYSPAVAYGSNGPTNLRATGSGSDIELRWDRPSEDASSISNYRLRWDGRTSTLVRVSFSVQILPSRRLHWRINSAREVNERYRRFQLRARRGNLESEWSNVVVFDMETDRTVTPPSAPENVVATVEGRAVALSWDAAGDDTIVRYEVRHAAGDVAADGDWGRHGVA